MFRYIARYLSAGGFVAIASLAVPPPAHAIPILDGNSNSSSFYNLSCTSCDDTSLTSNQIMLGTTAPGGSDSFLNIVPVSFSANADMLGLKLAELSLYVGKKPGASQTGVMFDYNLEHHASYPVWRRTLADIQLGARWELFRRSERCSDTFGPWPDVDGPSRSVRRDVVQLPFSSRGDRLVFE